MDKAEGRRFPLFVSLEGKKVLVFGAGAVAKRRIRVLLGFGADIEVTAPEIPARNREEFDKWIREGKISWKQKKFEAEDLKTSAFFVLAATDQKTVNADISALCREKQIPVNNASDASQCDFYFPSIVEKDEITIGIAGNGTGHGAVRRLRERMQEWIEGKGEQKMKITYLYHSGFAAEVGKTVLIFDYYKGKLPEFEKDAKLYVFASHAHRDHFTKKIFEWKKEYPDITYILSDDISAEKAPDRIFLSPGRTETVDEITVTAFRSTDEGAAFVVECGGKRIYHAGDLNWWHWEGESAEFNEEMKTGYQREIQKIVEQPIDVAFVVLDPRQEGAAFWGMEYFLEHADAKAVFPMHMWEDYAITERFMKSDGFLKLADRYGDRLFDIKEKGQSFIIR